MDIYENIDKALLGLYSNDRKFIQELSEVKKYYEFYEGRPYQEKDDLANDTGQLWKVKDRDYTPTREVRNLTKKLMKKQGRFMTSVPPTLIMSALDEADRESVDAKRGLIEDILEQGKFWNKFSKAFMDCTIGKRVLLALLTDLDEKGCPNNEVPLKFRFYTMPEFTYEFDPNDCDKLIKVQIAYQDPATVGKIQQEQRWHKWTYELKEGNKKAKSNIGSNIPQLEEYCWCTYEIVDGTNTTAFIDAPSSPQINEEVQENTQVELKRTWNTGFREIPCCVIFNDGLTGDVRGNSDIKDLMDMATDYNKTMSDYRDALRFKMFEQPVFTDVDSRSLDGIKIAPNSLIDIKSDPTMGDGSNTKSVAKVEMLSSTFNFQPATDSYLTSLKKDMYEIMEQPMPEEIKNVPSGKALKMIYYDLITRCEEKWSAWDEALKWLVHMIEDAIELFGLYSDNQNIGTIGINTAVNWKHNYPIPDDEAEEKQIAIQEVTAQVRSKKSYIEEYGYSEDAEAEFETILEEQNKMNEINNAMLGLDTAQNPNNNEEEEEEED